jgi:hypothetical protein
VVCSLWWLVLLGWLCKTLASANTVGRWARVALNEIENARGITPRGGTPSTQAPLQLLATQTWTQSTAQRPPGQLGACVGRARLLIAGARIRKHMRAQTRA